MHIRFSDICQEIVNLLPISPKIYTKLFALANNQFFTVQLFLLSKPFSIPLEKQVDYYLAVHKDLVQGLGASKAHTHLSKSLFTIVMGSNDIYNYFDSLSRSTPQQYVNLIVLTFKEQMKVTKIAVFVLVYNVMIHMIEYFLC